MRISMFLLLCVMLLAGGCRSDDCKHKKIIESLSNEPLNLEHPSRYEGLHLFVGCEDKNEKKITFPRVLKIEYLKNKYSMNYKTYLRKILNEDIHIDLPESCFRLNAVISDNYAKMNFNAFFSLYCYENGSVFRIAQSLSENESLTVLYYLFLNEYYSFWDDYIGIYSIRKLEN
ncbi:hypothetical protein M2137_000221 [Parabacteroides sp. PFB2-10]|uniref:hypothetical protein n=1 Tax=Parabacteroides sp. PFB2-10 TaxID=1742405 RepID=UPI002476404C|nr:hypothetical protein [Parabacteroides sp. PFB2-10]MDH6311471.1 hypothetical protein [Parabacteroides sp. PFB2-10]